MLHQKGTGGSIDFDNGLLVFHHNWLGGITNGVDEASVPVASIVSVGWIPGNMVWNPCLTVQVMLPDGSTSKKITKTTDGGEDPYSMVFMRHQSKGAHDIYEELLKDISASPSPLPERYAIHPKKTPTLRDLHSPNIFIGTNGIMKLDDSAIIYNDDRKPLSGVKASLEDGSDSQSRTTLTRLLATGVLAFGMKKRIGGEKYLVVEGPDFSWMVEVAPKKVGKAMVFVNNVNNAAKHMTTSAPNGTGRESPSELEQLASLHDKGILTDEEFSAAKAKALGI
ncbi:MULTISPECIES: SHOCT domain-containing protein [Bifidobacterium]|nr:SHOCT domain-containing protein [Bifidobacterium tibiigranuli]